MQDALDEVSRQRVSDITKPLGVHFIGESGIDAGGLKKEFFQRLTIELFSPDFDMFAYQEVSFCAISKVKGP